MKEVWPPTLSSRRVRLTLLVGGLVLFASLSTCSPTAPVMTRVEALKVLRIATFNSPTTYYEGAGGPTGFDYDLARSFAEDLGVELQVVVAESPAEIIKLVRSGRAHLAAGLAVAPARERALQFTTPLRTVVPQMVYRSGTVKPKKLYDLPGTLVVPANSFESATLRELVAISPQLKWTESEEFGSEQLLYEVARGEMDYTLAPSDVVAINRRYFPNLRVAFSLSDPQNIAWGFAKDDDSLFRRAMNFIDKLDRKELVQIRDRYFGHVEKVSSYGALVLATHVQTRLPRYREMFEAAAEKHNLDWRLLAAVGYQESHWNPAAKSPTGVRGLMQITTATAQFLKITDRLDPEQAIHGAASYLAKLRARIPDRVPEPDRTWMTLASYNIGSGHLEDGRILTQLAGGNPDRWIDVRTKLPLLTQARWHRTTKHGYARGHEAVTYVGNIRTYYDILAWLTGGPALANEDTDDEPTESIILEPELPLRIDSPIL